MTEASYNSFLQQVGYCKLQGYDTISRNTSMGPKMFLDGRVSFGVGLSETQFGSHVYSCGRCIQISQIDKFFTFNDQLTEWQYDLPMQTPFTVFVMDQCTDPICTSGFLDFDIYNPYQPVANGNPTNVQWEFVHCPVGDDPIEFLFCLGPNACNVHDKEGRNVQSLVKDAVDYGYWYMHVRNARTPVTSVIVQLGENQFALEDNQGWLWGQYEYSTDLTSPWKFIIESLEGERREYTIDWNQYAENISTEGYRGGVVLETDIQV